MSQAWGEPAISHCKAGVGRQQNGTHELKIGIGNPVRKPHCCVSKKQTTGTEKAKEEILCTQGPQSCAKVVARHP